ncbi:AraC family transcriptional regulator [Chitinophaga silvatica]|uniref:AraC family transcriptional regulator n=1 Tax=Chitinophaga silvatica TaxID=2282649 RepID=A0A3E1Y5P7_9BACT|nr:AraC family transcriptional regulator [Chitinophaga silvatica]RFS20059.1 AraC family transcriptional regulator [Chitinophaga silvatica]
MRVLKTEITPLTNEILHIDVRDQMFLWSPYHTQPCFHSHPELELVFILEGFGKRIIGNKIEPFEAGDMVFVGSNVPHLWLSDPAFYEEGSELRSKVIVTYINPKAFIEVFDSIKEFESIREMIKQSSKGIRIFGETRKVIAEKLISLSNIEGFEKVNGLLQIMNIISVSNEKEFIFNNYETDYYDDLYPDRLVDVIKFLKENLHEQITLRQVADIASMTEQSFCRFFKKRTQKNFSRYLSDLRIVHACHLLVQSDNSIREIAGQCGYSSASHFCKVFKEHTGVSPLQYKTSANQER